MRVPGRRDAAEAVAVRDGVVLAVGRREVVRRLAGAGAEHVRYPGAVLLPGLIDPHLHLLAMAARDAHLDCSGLADVAALLAAVASHARTLPAGAWVRGEGLDETRVSRLPTPAELDRASGGRPVRLRHRSRHASVLSAEALRRLGFAGTRRRFDGGPEGLIAGREAEIGRGVGPLPEEVMLRGLERVGRELATYGLTTVADATPRARPQLGLLRAAVRAGHLPQRVFAMRRPASAPWRGDERLRPGPVKLLVDEGPGGLRPEPRILARLIARAAAGGAQVAVHCTGSATLVAALAGFDALPAAFRTGHRHRLEHLGECPPPLVQRIARLGLVVVTNPVFVHLRGEVYRRETPRAAWSWLYRARSLLRAGVPLAGASDAPVGLASPWLGMAAARTRRTTDGRVLGAGERLSARQALALFTTGAAHALRADTLGRLLPGAPADLVAVEPDPLHAPPDEVADARVRLTMIGGRIAWPQP